jgi:hypothetical protein
MDCRKMPRTRSNINSSRILQNDDYDILNEYNTVLDGALDMRRKFSSVVNQVRQLEVQLQEKDAALQEQKNAIQAKEAEIHRLVTLRQQDLSNHQHFAEATQIRLQRQGRRLQRLSNAKTALRRRNNELARDLISARTQLDHVDHLQCHVCRSELFNTITICRHIYCKPCLDHWRAVSFSFTCPDCRRELGPSDFWEIHIEPDSKNPPAPPAHDDSDDATVILNSDSDSDVDSE